MKVSVEIFEEDLEGEYTEVPGLRLLCERCGHEASVFGTDDRSARRGAAMLNEECPRGENNFYDVDHY